MIMGNRVPLKDRAALVNSADDSRHVASRTALAAPAISPDTRATAALICKIAASSPRPGQYIDVGLDLGIQDADVDNDAVMLAFDAWDQTWDDIVNERRDGEEIDMSPNACDHRCRRADALAAALLEEGWEPS